MSSNKPTSADAAKKNKQDVSSKSVSYIFLVKSTEKDTRLTKYLRSIGKDVTSKGFLWNWGQSSFTQLTN
jgi:hypothetical protein